MTHSVVVVITAIVVIVVVVVVVLVVLLVAIVIPVVVIAAPAANVIVVNSHCSHLCHHRSCSHINSNSRSGSNSCISSSTPCFRKKHPLILLAIS